MADITITDDYLKAAATFVKNYNKTFPKESINYILDADYISSDAKARTMDYKAIAPVNMANKLGSAHGGYIAAISDELMGNAIHFYNSVLGPHYAVTTINMTFNCVKPIFAGEEIRLHIAIRHIGKRTASATCEIFKGDVLCAYSSESFAIIQNSEVPDVMAEANKLLNK